VEAPAVRDEGELFGSLLIASIPLIFQASPFRTMKQ
jgi:hypothetical protein